MPIHKIAEDLLRWYPKEARMLPWRADNDPYPVWVAEVMLQQTRVETVIPYYQKWMQRFPTLEKLAQSDLQDVLRVWEGLGYYSRGRNLHRAAQILMRDHHGIIPCDSQDLIRLPGIGRSTAGAIASISFNQDEPILDGNVKRVLTRLNNYPKPVNEPKNQDDLWKMAEVLLPKGRAGIFNQALMELGETICLPRKPLCAGCPIKNECQSFQLGLQEKRPVRKPKARVPHHEVAAAVICKDGTYLLTQRPEGKLLAGLWEFPGGKLEKGETLQQGLQRELQEELNINVDVRQLLGVYRHAYTHFTVRVHAFDCRLRSRRIKPGEGQSFAWVAAADFGQYPMGKVDRLIASQAARSEAGSV
jgi:A/G-specific adenine glycosylase